MTEAALPAPASASRGPARRMAGERGWLIGSALIAALVLAPVASLVGIAARGSGELWPHLALTVLPRAALDTIVLLGGVGVVTSVIGVGTAWLVSTTRFPGRAALDWALLLPLAVPTYIVAYAYLDLLHPLGPVQGFLRYLFGVANPRDLPFPDVRSMGGAVLLLGFVLYPYVYLAARAMFLMQSACVLDVARTLGEGRLGAFLRVALPLARPAVAVGATLALMEALNDIGASEFLGVRTLTVSIYTTWVNRSSLEGAAQIALVLLALVLLLVALERRARRGRRFAVQAQRSRRTSPVSLGGASAIGALTACLLPVMVGFVAPVAYLASESLRRVQAAGLPAGLVPEIAATVLLAGAATLVTLALGLVVAYAARVLRGPGPAVLARLASLGYALPGTVLAVGLLTPLAAFDNALDGVAREVLGVSTGLLLSGSGAALIYAYAVRFLAISAGGIEAGLSKIAPSLDAAARNLGEDARGVARRVHLPLLRPALGAAALLVFVDAMKELPATLLLRPFGVETLATHVYAEASRGAYEDGAIAALLIVLVGLVPVALLARASRLPFVEGGRMAGPKSEGG